MEWQLIDTAPDIADTQSMATELLALRALCTEVYQVVGVLAREAGVFNTPEVERALDNLAAAGDGKPLPHETLLPFQVQAAGPMADEEDPAVRIPSAGFVRGSIVRRFGGGPNMLVIRSDAHNTFVVVCEGDDDGTLRAREYLTDDLERALGNGAQQDELFDLRWQADMRAIARWREANPGNELVMPDHADLVVWLMDQLAAGQMMPEVPSAQELIDAVEYLVNSRCGGDTDVGTIVAYLLEVMGSKQLQTDIRAGLAKEQGRG